MSVADKKIGFTGHQGLAPETTAKVRDALAKTLSEERNFTGFCSLAEGSDQLFATTVLSHRGKLAVIIPCLDYESTFTDQNSLDSYRRLLSSASTVQQLNFEAPSEGAFWAAGKRVVDECDQLIAVWDGKEAAGLGGTGDVVHFAKSQGMRVTIIWPPGAARN